MATSRTLVECDWPLGFQYREDFITDADSDAFAMALINEYRPGTPIGWHRDAPQYDIVAGISLSCATR